MIIIENTTDFYSTILLFSPKARIKSEVDKSQYGTSFNRETA